MRLSILFLAFGLSACADVRPQIFGPYASRLSATDIEAIKILAFNDPDRSQVNAVGPPSKLEVIRPDYVHVDVPILDRDATTYSFNVVKRHGHWTVDGPPVIVTSTQPRIPGRPPAVE